MGRVIIKRLPIIEVIKQEVDDVGVSCECLDPLFHEPNPDCKYCNGTGIIKGFLPPEKIETKKGNKQVWVTSAKIVVDTAEAIYDEEDEVMISDTHAFFEPNENLQIGDIIIPEGSRTSYIIKSVQSVRSLNNVIMIDCALEQHCV